MKKLLQFETRRILHSVSALVCLIIAFVYSIADAFLMNLDLYEGESIVVSVLELMLSSLDLIPTLLAVFVCLYACNDYSNNTLKNIYARGFSREYVILSKLVMVLAYSVAITLVSWLGSLIGGALFGEMGKAPEDFAAALFASLFSIVAYSCVYFMFATLIRKTGGAIACGILGPILVNLVLSLIDIIFSKANVSFRLTEFWIQGYFNILTLTSFPVFSAKILTITYIMSVVYAAGSVALVMLIARRQNI